MKKLFLIGLKDLKLAMRDKAALTFMLLAPFLLTLGMGFVTGAFGSGGSSGIEKIDVLLVNQDEGELGGLLVDLFNSPDLADLLDPDPSPDPASARLAVENDKEDAAIIIPPGFTASIIPETGQTSPGVVKIEVYKNPLYPVSAGVIQSIVEEFVSRVETGRVGAEVVITQMLTAGLVPPDQVSALVAEVGARQASAVEREPAIRLASSQSGEAQAAFNVMAYMAPGMALMFLMFTVSNGGRTILMEKTRGTLPRLLVSPTNGAQVLIGKMFGIYLTGVLQMLILVVASSLIFGINWGDPLGVLVIILASVFGATGWGMLLTSVMRTPGQVSSVGSAVMLLFGILGGSFFPASNLPDWFFWLSRITPNAWGLDGFSALALGGGLMDLGEHLLGLGVMGVVLSLIAIVLFNRRTLAQK